jgi:hypothetical protein
MVNPRNSGTAAARTTEGTRPGSTAPGSMRKPGRPKGAKNKPKGLLPAEMANSILLQMKDMLPPEHFEYMKSVVRDGKAIAVKNELDVLILLLSRNLYPALVMEQQSSVEEEESVDDFFDNDEDAPDKPKESKIKMPVFRKDVTERLKVLQGLLSLRNQVEKRDSDSKNDEKQILRIVGGRGIDPGRLRILVGVESSAVVGDADGTGQQANDPRTVSGEIPERSVVLPSGEQESPDRVLDGDSG